MLLEAPLKPDNGSVDLPPYLKGKGPERGRYVILPDICRADAITRTQHDNCWTTHYFYMMRWWNDGRLEYAHVNTRRYKQWLETYQTKDGIPPHIAFGGAVVAGERDETFHDRWVAYALETFC